MNWKEIEPDTSKISKDLREIQKTVQDYEHRIEHLPMKIESLNQKVEEILNILPDLNRSMTDLRIMVTDLKEKQGITGTSKPRKDQIGDALGRVPLLHQKGKAKEVPKPKTQEELLVDILRSIK